MKKIVVKKDQKTGKESKRVSPDRWSFIMHSFKGENMLIENAASTLSSPFLNSKQLIFFNTMKKKTYGGITHLVLFSDVVSMATEQHGLVSMIISLLDTETPT